MWHIWGKWVLGAVKQLQLALPCTSLTKPVIPTQVNTCLTIYNISAMRYICLNGMLFVKFHSQLVQDIRVQYSMIYLKAKLSSIIINVLHVCITEVTVCICVCGTSYPVCVD